VIAAARDAVERYGAGTTGSRAANGTLAIHRLLEQEFAALYGKPHALIFTTGYQANLGLIAGLCGPDDVVLLDVESHASIYDGARLSGAQVFAFGGRSRPQAGAPAWRALPRRRRRTVLDWRRRRAARRHRRGVP
jgi:7-keto-8-aminopelargonate synthetase-like enzyme